MIVNVFLFIVSAGTAALLATRLHALVNEGELNVKGIDYSRQSTPIAIKFLTVAMGMGFILSFCLALVAAWMLAEGL